MRNTNNVTEQSTGESCAGHRVTGANGTGPGTIELTVDEDDNDTGGICGLHDKRGKSIKWTDIELNDIKVGLELVFGEK